jgi:hypothetical protein
LGGLSQGYDKRQRAYILESKNDQIIFQLDGSDKSPIVNPCFIIEGWDSYTTVSLNDDKISDNHRIRQGMIRDTNGQLQLIVWIMVETNESTAFKFQRSE